MKFISESGRFIYLFFFFIELIEGKFGRIKTRKKIYRKKRHEDIKLISVYIKNGKIDIHTR